MEKERKIVSIVSYVCIGGREERPVTLVDLSRFCGCTDNNDVINCLFERLDNGFLISYYEENGKRKELRENIGIRKFEEILTSRNHFRIRVTGHLFRPNRKRTKNRILIMAERRNTL